MDVKNKQNLPLYKNSLTVTQLQGKDISVNKTDLGTLSHFCFFLKPTGILWNNPYFPIPSHTLKCSHISHTDTHALFTVDNTISVRFPVDTNFYEIS